MIARVRAGKPEAYGELVRAHTGIVLQAARALGVGADAEDVVQQAFFKAYCSLGRFRDGVAFRKRLLSIVADETRNTVRTAGRRRSLAGREAAFVEAGRRAGFAPLVPGAPGTPDAVSVPRAPKNRFVVTACWDERGETVRLDEYAARPAPGYGKSVAGAQELEWAELSGGSYEVLWPPEPHLLRFWTTSEDGSRLSRSGRAAGPTLLWVHDDEYTLRLEGVESTTRSRENAQPLER